MEELKEAANAKLEEVTQKLEAAEPFWKTWGEKNKMQAKLNGTKSQLKEKSDAVVKLKGEVEELKELIAQLKGKVQFKEEELTDDEDFTFEEAKAKIEELQAKATIEKKPFKFRFSQRIEKQGNFSDLLLSDA